MVEYNIDLNDKTVLVTGAAGFIGANFSKPSVERFRKYKGYWYTASLIIMM